MDDGRAEGLSAIGDGGQAAISLTPTLMTQVLVLCWIQLCLLSLKNDPVMSG